MKVFKASARIFKLHCYLPPESTNKWIRYGCVMYTISVVVGLILLGWSSWCFFVSFFAIDNENALCALYQVMLVAGPLCSFSSVQFLKKDVENLFTAFQNFYDQNKVMDISGTMRKAEMRGRRVVRNFLSFAVICCVINLVTGLVSLLYHRIRDGDFSKLDEVHRPYRYTLPWNQSTLGGWIGEMGMSLVWPINYFVISSAFLTLLVTICEYHRSFCEIIDYNLTTIDDVMRSGTYRMGDLIKMFRKTVSFHCGAKEVGLAIKQHTLEAGKLFLRSSDLYSCFVAVELIYFMALMTFVVFGFDYAIRNINLHMALSTMGTFYCTAVLYVYCYYGQNVTDSYAAIADHLYESDWMNAPIGLQKMYVLMIAHAQKKIHYSGWGIVKLNLETFLWMIKSVIGYVLMIKTFADEYS